MLKNRQRRAVTEKDKKILNKSASASSLKNVESVSSVEINDFMGEEASKVPTKNKKGNKKNDITTNENILKSLNVSSSRI